MSGDGGFVAQISQRIAITLTYGSEANASAFLLVDGRTATILGVLGEEGGGR